MIEHGTPTNTTCHGSDCLNKGSATLMTCDEAVIRYRGDYPYMNAVKAGTATAEKETYTVPKPPRLVLETVEEAAARPAPVKKSRRGTLGRRVVKVMIGKAGVTHGTPSGAKACNTNCPNEEAGGISCTDARRAWQREYRKRRIAGDGPPLNHGTIHAYQGGCTTVEGCPLPAGETCTDVKRAAGKLQDKARREGRPR